MFIFQSWSVQNYFPFDLSLKRILVVCWNAWMRPSVDWYCSGHRDSYHHMILLISTMMLMHIRSVSIIFFISRCTYPHLILPLCSGSAIEIIEETYVVSISYWEVNPNKYRKDIYFPSLYICCQSEILGNGLLLPQDIASTLSLLTLNLQVYFLFNHSILWQTYDSGCVI